MKEDNVNHPKHYTSHPSGVECITITEHMSFLRGNALKYLWRADEKNGLEDLKKAAWYLNREIEKQEPKGALLSPTRPMLVQNSVGDVVRDAPAPLGAKRGRKGRQEVNVGGAVGFLLSKRDAHARAMGKMQEQAERFIRSNPGCTGEALRSAVGATPAQMPKLRAMMKKEIRTKGARRGMRYFIRGNK